MLPISCIRCHRPYSAAAPPRPGVRCPICHGRLEASATDGGIPGRARMPIALPPIARAEAGSYEQGEHVFASLVEFVNDDPRRGPSRECDVGLTWRGAEGRTYRAAWVCDTGELVLVQTGDTALGGGHVEILGCAPARETLFARLEGWERACGGEMSVEWLRTRAERRLESPVGRVRGLGRTLSGGSQTRPRVLPRSAPSIG